VMEIKDSVVIELADEAAKLRKNNGLSIPEAIKQVLQKWETYDNIAYFLKIAAELGKRGGKKPKIKKCEVKKRGTKINIHRTLKNIEKRELIKKQTKEAEEMARERRDDLLPDP